MYAIIESGGKQYRVRQGDTIRVEKLPVDVGDTITFDRVLLVSGESGVRIGEPIVAGAGVTAEALDHDRDKKVRIVKFRRRKHSLKRQGHRQHFTTVKITNITE